MGMSRNRAIRKCEVILESRSVRDRCVDGDNDPSQNPRPTEGIKSQFRIVTRDLMESDPRHDPQIAHGAIG